MPENPKYSLENEGKDKKISIKENQVNSLVKFGFHKLLGISLDEYKESIPEISIQPKEYNNHFDIPLVVDPRVPISEQLEISGIKARTNIENIINVTEVPNKPYTIWTHDARRYRHLTVEEACRKFSNDEVGSPLIEVIALYMQYPRIFKDFGIDAAGSRVDSREGHDYVPSLILYDTRKDVIADRIDIGPYHEFGALSRGKKIGLRF